MMGKDKLVKNMQVLFFVTIILTIIALYVQEQTRRKEGGSRIWPDQRMSSKVEYYPNGKVRYAGSMKGYLKHGKWSWFDEQGRVIRVEYYRDGELIDSTFIPPDVSK